MSHCTKFEFAYSNERSIVKAFKKLGCKCTTDMVALFNSEFAKNVLSEFNPFGSEQVRAICGAVDGYNLLVCRGESGSYYLMVENAEELNQKKVKELEKRFKMAYIGVAIDSLVKKLDDSGMPSEVLVEKDRYVVNFGESYQYSAIVSINRNKMVEEVKGIKGDFCAKLTEDIEDILSHPDTELRTEWTNEAYMVVDDQNIQVLSLQF